MKPSYLPCRRAAHVCLLALFTACTAATEAPGGDKSQNRRSWSVRFDNAPAADVAVYEVTIVAGSCASPDGVHSEEVGAEGTGTTPGGLGPGSYAIVVRARDVDCRVVASGCSEFKLPSTSDDVIELRLEPTRPRFACSARVCTDGHCAQELDSDDGGFDFDAGALADAAAESGAPSASAIYGIKRGVVRPGTEVTAEGVATAVTDDGFFLQVPESEHIAPDHGHEFSAVYVHMSDAVRDTTAPVVGQLASVRARVRAFLGQIQLHEVEFIQRGVTGQALPTPRLLAPADIATGGPLADAYEAALVRVEGAVVDSERPAPTPPDESTNEFSVGGGLRVGDLFYAVDPVPSADALMNISGVLRFSRDHSKLEPRDAVDVGYTLGLKPFANPRVCVPEGSTESASMPVLVVELTGPAPAAGAEIALSSSAPEVSVPPTIAIAPGETQAAIPFNILGPVTTPAVLTATFQGGTATALVNVADASVPRLAGTEPEVLLLEPDGSAELRVQLQCPAPSGGVAYDVASDSAAAVVGGPLTFAEGDTEAVIQVAGGQDSTATITIERGADRLDTTAVVQSVLISEVFYNPTPEDDSGWEYVELYNPGAVAVDLSQYSIGHSDDASLADNGFTLEGSIGPGECFVVGGPNNPGITFDLARAFQPKLRDAGSRAEGVAVFKLAREQVSASSVPIDHVMYGPLRPTNDIRGHSGHVLDPDVASSGIGRSIERTRLAGWVAGVVPSPGDCTPLQ